MTGIWQLVVLKWLSIVWVMFYFVWWLFWEMGCWGSLGKRKGLLVLGLNINLRWWGLKSYWREKVSKNIIKGSACRQYFKLNSNLYKEKSYNLSWFRAGVHKILHPSFENSLKVFSFNPNKFTSEKSVGILYEKEFQKQRSHKYYLLIFSTTWTETCCIPPTKNRRTPTSSKGSSQPPTPTSWMSGAEDAMKWTLYLVTPSQW